MIDKKGKAVAVLPFLLKKHLRNDYNYVFAIIGKI